MRQFLSDNAAAVHPRVWDAMRAADLVVVLVLGDGGIGGEHQRVVAPDSTTSAGNDAHSFFTQSCHDDVSLVSSDLEGRL